MASIGIWNWTNIELGLMHSGFMTHIIWIVYLLLHFQSISNFASNSSWSDWFESVCVGINDIISGISKFRGQLLEHWILAITPTWLNNSCILLTIGILVDKLFIIPIRFYWIHSIFINRHRNRLHWLIWIGSDLKSPKANPYLATANT